MFNQYESKKHSGLLRPIGISSALTENSHKKGEEKEQEQDTGKSRI
jgi:hypothetical protein